MVLGTSKDNHGACSDGSLGFMSLLRMNHILNMITFTSICRFHSSNNEGVFEDVFTRRRVCDIIVGASALPPRTPPGPAGSQGGGTEGQIEADMAQP